VTLIADLQFFRDPHNEIFREEYKEATLPQVVQRRAARLDLSADFHTWSVLCGLRQKARDQGQVLAPLSTSTLLWIAFANILVDEATMSCGGSGG
jgi:hypothetical protein